MYLQTEILNGDDDGSYLCVNKKG